MRRLIRPECVFLLLAGTIAGCGSTARDEFIYNRQVQVRPLPGDGSRIASNRDTALAPRPTAAAPTPVASVRED